MDAFFVEDPQQLFVLFKDANRSTTSASVRRQRSIGSFSGASGPGWDSRRGCAWSPQRLVQVRLSDVEMPCSSGGLLHKLATTARQESA